MYVHKFDIRIAFLDGNLVEETYMIQLEGYVQLGKMTLVCRLKKVYMTSNK
jgi:hypothetical protein